jgi:hypothetical protein
MTESVFVVRADEKLTAFLELEKSRANHRGVKMRNARRDSGS